MIHKGFKAQGTKYQVLPNVSGLLHSFILNSLNTVAPSTKSGCFQGAVAKPTYNTTKIKKNTYNVKLE